MLKNLCSHIHVSVPNLGDSFVVVLANTDSSAADINEALLNTTQTIEEGNDYPRDQTRVRRVWDIQTIPYNGLTTGGSIQHMIQWKLPPKGLPILKGRGLQWMCFNTDSANSFANGPSFKALTKMMGGWF